MNNDFEDFIKSGKILEKALNYARHIIKRDILLLEIAEKIEDFISKENAKCAFPPNLSMNEIAAHYSPFENDKTTAGGLLKVDIGVMLNGCIADAAISINLDTNEENKKLIKASNEALKAALKVARPETEVWEIGSAIEEKISEFEFKPIYNLSGHSIIKNNLHSGKTIPNYNNKDKTKLQEDEIIAIEPFVTTANASGYVNDGRPSSIWALKMQQRPRLYREVYDYINKNYASLPFSQRWLKKNFSNAVLALNLFSRQGIAHNYCELVEKAKAKVSQAETTIIVRERPIVLVDVFEI